jgi:hypothetical protein
MVLTKHGFSVTRPQHLRNAEQVKRILPMAEETIVNFHNITTATHLNHKTGSTNAMNGHGTRHANNEDSAGTKGLKSFRIRAHTLPCPRVDKESDFFIDDIRREAGPAPSLRRSS